MRQECFDFWKLHFLKVGEWVTNFYIPIFILNHISKIATIRLIHPYEVPKMEKESPRKEGLVGIFEILGYPVRAKYHA